MSDLPQAEPAPELVAARQVLLDALDILAPHKAGLILIGAQAVYMHLGTGTVAAPPTTTDADLALDTDLLAVEPEIASALADAGFTCPNQPGHWVNAHGLAVDLMVATHQSGRTKTKARSARIPPHDNRTARPAQGLAPAIADNSVETVRALDPADPRSHQIRVAGAPALLVAKTIKIQERLANEASGQLGRVIDKDALDILRLLQGTSTADVLHGLTQHEPGSAAARECQRTLEALRGLGADDSSPLATLATRAALGDPTIAPSMRLLVGELLDAADQGRQV